MLSVAKLTPGQESYYERSVAAGIDDYYAGRGESPGVWVARGATELDLAGVVGEGELGRLVNGRHPLTSAQLRRHPPKRVIHVERIDAATGERRLEPKTLAPVAGFDLVFSAPKSVSLLHALGGDDVRHAVTQAHLVAWQAALAYLEREACVTRKGRDGAVREHASGFIAAAYQHRTSRAQDPHLHTHVIVANVARSPDGTWRALDGEAILKTYRLAAGCLYQAQLRHELTRTLGVEWREPVKGMAELDGVPEAALRAFSQRRNQVLEYMEAHGTSGFYASKVAAVETRERKEEVDLPQLREEWRARASEHGFGGHELAQLLGRTVVQEPAAIELRQVARRLAGPEGLTEKQTTFTEPESVAAWAEAHAQGAPVERVLELADRFVEGDDVVLVDSARSPGRPRCFSTQQLVAVERAAVALVDRGRDASAPRVAEDAVERVLAARQDSRLALEQEAMVRAAATSGDRVTCVVGRAGAGKTTALRAVADVFRADEVVVVGAAPSGVAAEALARESRIPSTTLHSLVAHARRSGGFARGCVLVVDEAGMADTRTLADALHLVEGAHGKAILVGDPAQLPAVGAGGLFAALVARCGVVELKDNHRQRDELERRALEALRCGDSGDYLALAASRRRLVVTDDPTDAKAQLVADWWEAARGDLVGSVMIAYRRRDVAELNNVAHRLMEREGRLGDKRLALPTGLELARGDRIVCLHNERRLGITNGTRATIADVDPDAGAINLETDDRRRVTLPLRYLEAGHVARAYALTGHKTQGLTVERAFVLATGEAALKEWGYVALSRAREETRVYATAAELETDTHAAFQPERPHPVERLADGLARSAAENLAIDAATPPQRAHSDARGSDRSVLMRQARALVERRVAADRLRSEASRKLREAERELNAVGIFGRARRGRGLRERIVERRHALEELDREVDRIERELRALHQTLAPPRRQRTRERTLERGLGLEL